MDVFTTTVAMILGLLIPSAGAITVLGEDMLRRRHRVLGRMNFSSVLTWSSHFRPT